MKEITKQLHQSGVGYAKEHGAEYDAILTVGFEQSYRQPQIIFRLADVLPVYHIALYEWSVADDDVAPIYQPDSLVIAVVDLLDDLLSQDKKVLVHCDAGMVRSVAICAAWLVKTGRFISFQEAVNFCGGDMRQNTLMRQMERIYGH